MTSPEGARRDPVSVSLDRAARSLLARAYANPGQWVSTRLVDPDMRIRTRFAGMGIDLDKPDNGGSARGGRSGGLNARTRFGRGFVRALYYQHKWYSHSGSQQSWNRRTSPRDAGALRIEVGRHIPASPQFDPAHPERGGFPAGRAVRVQIARGGRVKLRAVQRLSDRDRIWTDAGGEGDRYSDITRRDWA